MSRGIHSRIDAKNSTYTETSVKENGTVLKLPRPSIAETDGGVYILHLTRYFISLCVTAEITLPDALDLQHVLFNI